MALIKVIQQKEMINDSNRASIYLPLLLILLAMFILALYMGAVSYHLSLPASSSISAINKHLL